MRNISLTLFNRRDRLVADLPVCQNSPSIVLQPGKAAAGLVEVDPPQKCVMKNAQAAGLA
jgi:hypothetical protein